METIDLLSHYLWVVKIFVNEFRFLQFIFIVIAMKKKKLNLFELKVSSKEPLMYNFPQPFLKDVSARGKQFTMYSEHNLSY